MQKLTVNFDPDTRFCELIHSYNKRFVTYVSQAVKPPSRRKYSSETRRWSVHVSKLPQVVAVATRYFQHVDYRAVPPEVQIRIVQFMDRVRSAPPVVGGRHKTPHEMLFVTPDAPPEVIKAAYRALAQKHHPDHDGDPERFREVDEAWKKLKT